MRELLIFSIDFQTLHLIGLKCCLAYVHDRFKCKNDAVFKTDTHRQTEKQTTVTLSRMLHQKSKQTMDELVLENFLFEINSTNLAKTPGVVPGNYSPFLATLPEGV